MKRNYKVNLKDIRKIFIKFIDHEKQRYETVGDYWINWRGLLQVRISRMSDPRYMFLVLVHELVELAICLHRGITFKDIDAFDKQFERERAQGLHGADDEPGDDRRAPYHDAHVTATGIEKTFAAALDVDWDAYDKEVTSLSK